MTARILDRRRLLVGGTTLAATCAFGAGSPQQVAKAQTPSSPTQPNILFILADNLGYGELGTLGQGRQVSQ